MKIRDRLKTAGLEQELWSIHPAMFSRLTAKMENEAWLDEDDDDAKKDQPPQSILRVENGVGIIPITGTLMSENHWLFWWFGETSYEGIQRAAQEAKQRSDIRVVRTMTDSPGGLVSGAHDTSDAIRDLAQVKPVVAYNANQMTSAAYWANTHATRLVSAPTGFVGSIGVATVHREMSGLEKRIGIKSTDIASGDLKRIASLYEPLSEDAYNYLKQQCVDCAAVFVGDVQQARGMSDEHAAEIARAGTYLGSQGVTLGLVDSVGLLPHLNMVVDTLKEARGAGRSIIDLGRNSSLSNTNADNGGEQMALTAEETKAVQATAQSAERKRIADIKALAPIGMEGYAEALAFDEQGYTVAEAAVKILAEQKANPPKLAAPAATLPPAGDPQKLNQFLGEAPLPLKVVVADPKPDPKATENAVWDAAYRASIDKLNGQGYQGNPSHVTE